MPSITTVANIRARAKRQLNEPSGTDEGFWSDTDYLNCINEGQDDFVMRTKCLKSYATFTTDGTNKEYCLNETALGDFMDIAEVWFFWDDDNYDVLRRVSRDELSSRESFIRDLTGNPTYYCYEDRVIEFDTIPDEDDTCRIYYYEMPDTMSADTETPDIPNRYHNALVYYVCWKFCEADDTMMDKVAYFRQAYQDLVLEAMSIESPAASSYARIKQVEELPYV